MTVSYMKQSSVNSFVFFLNRSSGLASDFHYVLSFWFYLSPAFISYVMHNDKMNKDMRYVMIIY